MFGEVEMLEMIKEAKGQTDPLSVRSTPACRPANCQTTRRKETWSQNDLHQDDAADQDDAAKNGC